jgi:hypothetical protein
MSYKSLFFLITLSLLVIACNSSEDESTIDRNLPINEQIDLLIEQNRYNAALEILKTEDINDSQIRNLLEKTHLNYGLHSMNTFDQTEMRTRMNNALLQFTEVLRLNPNNVVAREQIGQILSIYETIPGREPEPDVLEGLREVGF